MDDFIVEHGIHLFFFLNFTRVEHISRSSAYPEYLHFLSHRVQCIPFSFIRVSGTMSRRKNKESKDRVLEKSGMVWRIQCFMGSGG